ncbi:deaminase [Kribbella turkmenica]|uniref:Deaminase n=1 Tax=Kribbella turkmenica TaxID=2530375 RepID=A0A4R4WRN8_9ACTN|nr:dihydrofolate reductase family protein [Kribbella turkmenica]TDD18590.1 deaminase [Kribbella turkmenica]
MRTLTVDVISSLDGFGAAEGWPGYWGKEGPEVTAWFEEKLAEDHAIVMGANTFREMSRIVTELEDPTFARMAEVPKYVFSKTLEPPLAWANTEVIAEDAVTVIRRLKAEGSVPLRTMGSMSLSKALVRAGLVDTLQIVLFPVITGQTGLSPIFTDWPDLDLELVTARTFDGRMQLLEYVPTPH